MGANSKSRPFLGCSLTVIEDLVTTLRVELASVLILSFKLKRLRSKLGSQEVREKKKELIEVLPMKEQS